MPAGAPQGGMPVRKFNSQDKAGKKMVKTNSQDMVFDEIKKRETTCHMPDSKVYRCVFVAKVVVRQPGRDAREPVGRADRGLDLRRRRVPERLRAS